MGALLVVALVFGACAWGAYAVVQGTHHATAPPTTTAAAPKQLRITFPEGLTTAQMARIADRGSRLITRRGYLHAADTTHLPAEFGRPSTPEGFLFPDTYFVFETDTSVALVEKQLENFRSKWSEVNLRYARSKNLTPYDVLTIASMIEKEAVVESERPLIAAVIYNRLHARVPLGIDATIRYALDVPGTESLTKTDLRDPTPYNTRLHRGLPPTPIANPGLASIRAAAHPARVDYLYFVAKPDKRHHYFTASYDDFNRYKSEHGYR